MFLLILACVLPLALTNDITFLLSEVCSVWNLQFEVEVRNHAEPRCWWRDKVQMVWKPNLLCAIDYFGDGKEDKLPGKHTFHFGLCWVGICSYRSWVLTRSFRDACLNIQKFLSYSKLSIFPVFELLEVNRDENQAFNIFLLPCTFRTLIYYSVECILFARCMLGAEDIKMCKMWPLAWRNSHKLGSDFEIEWLFSIHVVLSECEKYFDVCHLNHGFWYHLSIR